MIREEEAHQSSKLSTCKNRTNESGRWGPYRQASSPPARHRPGARSARRERCLSILSQTKGRETMKRSSSAASLALAVLTALAVLGLAGPGAAAEPLPFKGTGEGMRTSFTPLTPPFFAAEVVITGTATHLGQYELVLDAIVAVNDPVRTSIGTFQFVAANGDTLTGEFTGTSTPTATPGVNEIVETAIITGGTGRFAGATGGFTVERLFDTATLLTIGAFEGTISATGP